MPLIAQAIARGMSPEEVEEFNFPKDNAVYKTGFTMLPPKAGGMAYSAASLTGGG